MNAELSCRQCRDALVELTAGTISAADHQAVGRHLASCTNCQRERENWLALGDVVRASGEDLPADSGFATGLVRLRMAITLLNDDDFENPEGDNLIMERDSQFTDTHAPMVRHESDRPVTAGTARWRSYSALAATVVIVLLMALVFGTLATRLRPSSIVGAGGPATPTATSGVEAPSQMVQALPGGESVAGISMISTSEGWAVANQPNSSGAILVHYTSGHWTPSGDTYAGVYLMGISMDSHDDGWAVGSHPDQGTGIVLHYSGGRWSEVQTGNTSFAGGRVWAFSPTQVLVLASLPKDQTGHGGSALVRYNNGTWTKTVSPRQISGMSVLSADDFWAACLDGHILHYQGGQWTTYSIAGQSTQQSSPQVGQPLSIGMLSDSDGWVTGFINATPEGIFLAHFDGHTWTRAQGPAASGPTNIWAMSLVSASDGWAGGELMTSGSSETVLLHYVNGRWERTAVRYSGEIQTIVMVSATEGWATVNDGAVAGLLHYQDGHWTPYTPAA